MVPVCLVNTAISKYGRHAIRWLGPAWICFSAFCFMPRIAWPAMDIVQLRSGGVIEGVIVENEELILVATIQGRIGIPSAAVLSVTRVDAREAMYGLAEAYLQAGRPGDASRTVQPLVADMVWAASVSGLVEKIEARTRPRKIVLRSADIEETIRTISGENRQKRGLVNLAEPQREDWGVNRDVLHLILAWKAWDRLNYARARHHLQQIASDSPYAEEAARLLEHVNNGKAAERPDTSRRTDEKESRPRPGVRLNPMVLASRWPTKPSAPPDLIQLVMETADEFGVPAELALAVVQTESAWNPRAKSPKGACGLMQLMPGTASDLGVKDAFDPQQNVRGGMEYLSALLELYENDELALAAYNAGPRAVERAGGVPPYKETKGYLQKTSKLRSRLAELLKERSE